MRTLNWKLWATASALALLVSPSFSQSKPSGTSSDWKAILQSRLPLYGHRNWIVVSGIETIVANESLPSVLKYVAGAISSTRHVRATVFLDKELQFIDEHDYPGVSELRSQISTTFPNTQVSSIPHAEAMSKVDDAGKTFRILFIKTTATIPYTSVYLRLDCGYMNEELDRKISAAMEAASQQPPK